MSDIDRERPPLGVPDWLETSAAWTWRLGLLVLAALAALRLASMLLVVSLPVVVAVILTTVAVPPARRLERAGLRPGAAAGVVVIGGALALSGLLIVLAPSFVDELKELRPTLTSAWDSILNWLETGPLGYDAARVEELIESLSSTASSSSTSIVGGVIAGVSILVQGIAALLLMLVLLFFFVKDGEDIVNWFVARTPERHTEVIIAVGRRSWIALSGYVRGTILIAFIDAAGIAIGLVILDVPLVLPLALLVFLGGFIPVIGAFLAGLLAVAVALADGGAVTAGLALVMILAVQQLEGTFLQPMIMKRAVALHPIVILVAVAAGAALAGIVGAFLAVPVTAVVSAIGNELRVRGEEPATT